MLTIKNLSISFGERQILKDVSVEFSSSGLYIIRGENGNGKTTLLNIIAGKLTDFEGEIFVDGHSINKNELVELGDEHVSYLTQDSLLFNDISSLENVLVPYTDRDEQRAKNLLIKLGLENNIDQTPSSLSAGEKERLCFARLLYGAKEIVLLDEVTSNLDEQSEKILLDNILELSKSHLVVFVTHENISSVIEDNANILEVANQAISVIANKNVEKDSSFSFSDSKRKNKLLKACSSALERNKKAYIILSLISLICVAVGTLFYNFFFSFESRFDKEGMLISSKYSEIARDAYLSTTPVFSVTNPEEYEGTKYQQIYFSVMPISSGNFEAGSRYTSFCLYSDDTDVEVVQGTYPSNMNEVIISDICFEHYGNDSFSPFVLNFWGMDYVDFTVVGIYRSVENDLSSRYKNQSDDTYSFYTHRDEYGFKAETIFGLYDNSLSDSFFVENTKHNREIFSEQNPNLRLSPEEILVDSNGNEVLDFYSYYISNIMFFGIAEGAMLILLFSYIIAFYTRNRRRYILLRFNGISRKRLVAGDAITFSVLSLLSTAVGLIAEAIILPIMNNIYSNMILGVSSLSIFSSSAIPFLVSFGVSILAILFFLVILLFFLAKKDISSDILEIRKR